MTTQTEKFKLKGIEAKLKEWVKKGLQWYDYENANVLPLRYHIDYSGGTFEFIYRCRGKEDNAVWNIVYIDNKLEAFKPAVKEGDQTNKDETEIKILTKNQMAKDNLPANTDQQTETKTEQAVDIKTLQTFIFQGIQKLISGNMKSEEAKALSSLGQTVINSYKVDIEYKKLKSK